MKKYLIIFLILLLAVFLTGCRLFNPGTSIISGFIYSEKYFEGQIQNAPLAEATVVINNTATTTSSTGYFRVRIDEPDNNTVWVEISRQGFKGRSFSATLSGYRTNLGNIILEPHLDGLAAAYGNVYFMQAYQEQQDDLLEEALKVDKNLNLRVSDPFFDDQDLKEIIIEYHKPELSLEQALTIHQQLGAQSLGFGNYSRLERVLIPEEMTINEAIAYYQSLPQVATVEPNYPVYLLGEPNDEYYGLQWNLPLINTEEAWSFTTGSEDILVAVIDTGILRHEDLFPDPSSPFHSDWGNIRWDLAYDFVDGDRLPFDAGASESSQSHGTHVAGIIGALTNNTIGVAGINWQVGIIPLRIFDNNDNASIADLIDAIYYAKAKNANIINMSLGTPSLSSHNFTLLSNACQSAYNDGITLIAAAGNYPGGAPANSVMYPAAFSSTIAVGAVDRFNSRVSYSARGSELDLMAPGGTSSKGVLSTAGFISNNITAQRYTEMSGTSMAAAHVSGAAALLMAAGVVNDPADIKEALEKTASNYPNWNSFVGYGTIDIARALIYFANPDVFAGVRIGSSIYASSEIVPAQRYAGNWEYELWQIDPGQVRIYAWADINNNNRVDSGDLFGSSSLRNFYSAEMLRVDINNFSIQAMQSDDEPSLKVIPQQEHGLSLEELLEKKLRY